MLVNAEAHQKFQTLSGACLFLWLVLAVVFIPTPAWGAGLSRDPALDLAATHHAQDVHTDPHKAERQEVKRSMRRRGLFEAQFLVFAARGSTESVLEARRAYEAKVLPGHGMTHFGEGSAGAAGNRLHVVIYSRRLLELAPLSARLPKDRTLRVQGRSAYPMRAYLLGPCGSDPECAGSARRVLEQPKGHFAFEVPPAGSHLVLEIEVDTERGPEAAAFWVFGRGARPAPRSLRNADELLGALQKTRARFDLAPLEADAGLAKAATAQAKAVCRAGSAAHILPGGSEPGARGISAGHARVTENVAIADTPGRLHQNLMWSPSHRLARLAPTARSIGVGLVHRPAQPGLRARWCIVELISALAPQDQYR